MVRLYPNLSSFALSVLLAFSAVLPALPARGQDNTGGRSAATPAPLPLPYSFKAVFVFSEGTDQSSSAQISISLATNLSNMVAASKTPPALPVQFVPQGTWGLKNFEDQCDKQPDNTVGAIVVLPAAATEQKDNYLLVVTESETVRSNVLAIACTDPTTLPTTAEATPPPADQAQAHKKTPVVEWMSPTATGKYGHAVVQFLPLAVLTSVYLAFAPQKTFQTTTTRNFPLPSPLPAYGAVSSTATQDSNVINSSGTATLQNNIVSAVGVATLVFGREGTPEHYTDHAAEDVAYRLALSYSQNCHAPAASAPTIKPDYCNWLP